MKTPTLSTVYLDNQRIGLMGDPLPQVAKIVAASGKAPESVRVLRGSNSADTNGAPVRLDETIDRTADPQTPIYLTCVKKQPDKPDSRDKPSPSRVTPSTERPAITRTQFSDVGQDAEQRAPGPLPPLPDNQPGASPSSRPSGPQDRDDSPQWRL